MGEKNKFVVALVFVLSIAVPPCALCQMDGADMNREVYEKQINHIIECCKSKVKMSNSKHKNICDTGRQAFKKAAFCTNNKQRLIVEMVQINIPPKGYKIDYFVNAKFFEFEKNNPSVNQEN